MSVYDLASMTLQIGQKWRPAVEGSKVLISCTSGFVCVRDENSSVSCLPLSLR